MFLAKNLRYKYFKEEIMDFIEEIKQRAKKDKKTIKHKSTKN